MQNRFVIALILLLSSQLKAEVVLPRILGHNMVLQRNKPLTIWGKALAGEAVSVRFAGQNQQAVTDAKGHWQVVLQPLTASNVPAELIISGSNTIRLQNILVGEVWLCSGQSNMEFTMRKNSKVARPAIDGQNPVDELDYAKNPDIRIFLVNRKELIKPDSLHRGWSVARDSALRSFSAPAYFFAKELQQRLKVPVGVISSAIPGSRIEPWIAEDAFRADTYFADKKLEGEPGKFYEPMIRPLVPFSVAGFLWYQGETNCFLAETTTYSQKMKTLITSWRTVWNDASLPFYFVSIAPHTYSESKGKVVLTKETLPAFREAQELTLQLPNTGMIVTTDLVDNLSDIHPSYKWEIGRRLALVALHNAYGQNELVASGPTYAWMKRNRKSVVLTFDNVGSGLVSKNDQPLTDFMVAGTDGVFKPAQAVIEGNTVVVSSGEVKKPVAVRFGWNEAAQPNLFNKEGLPARPFRTDNPLTGKLQ